ncbi:hypothetical protein ACPA9J_29860 [Pseudomonas aeruginosa]
MDAGLWLALVSVLVLAQVDGVFVSALHPDRIGLAGRHRHGALVEAGRAVPRTALALSGPGCRCHLSCWGACCCSRCRG